MLGREKGKPEVVNMGKMDVARCGKIKGILNEHEECLIKATDDPSDPDRLLLEAMRYTHPGAKVGGVTDPSKEG